MDARTTVKDVIASHLRNRRSFKVGNISAERFGPFKRGQMPDVEYRKMIRDEPVYIVYSYETPIAWLLADGTPYVSTVRYSITTNKHQQIVKENLR